MSLSNSQSEAISWAGSLFSGPYLPDYKTFCVVCGRFGHDFVLRKSGLKCGSCVGKASKKSYVALQQRQASQCLFQRVMRAKMCDTGSTEGVFKDHYQSYCAASCGEGSEFATQHQPVVESGVCYGMRHLLPIVSEGPISFWASGHATNALAAKQDNQQSRFMEFIDNSTSYQTAASRVCATYAPNSVENKNTVLYLAEKAACGNSVVLNGTTGQLSGVLTRHSDVNDDAVASLQDTGEKESACRATQAEVVGGYGVKTEEWKEGDQFLEEDEEKNLGEDKEKGLKVKTMESSCVDSVHHLRKELVESPRKGSLHKYKSGVMVDDSIGVSKQSVYFKKSNNTETDSRGGGLDFLTLSQSLQSSSVKVIGSKSSVRKPMRSTEKDLNTVLTGDAVDAARVGSRNDLTATYDCDKRYSRSTKCTSFDFFSKRFDSTKVTKKRFVGSTHFLDSFGSLESSLGDLQSMPEDSSAIFQSRDDASAGNFLQTKTGVLGEKVIRVKIHDAALKENEETLSFTGKPSALHMGSFITDTDWSEIKSNGPLVSFFSSAAPSSFLAESNGLLNGETGEKEHTFLDPRPQSLFFNDAESAPCVAIDRFYVVVKMPLVFFCDGLSKQELYSFSFSLTSPAKTTDQDRSCGFAVARHLSLSSSFSSSFACKCSDRCTSGSRVMLRHNVIQHVSSVNCSSDTTLHGTSSKQRYVNSELSDRVEVEKIFFILSLRDCDSGEELYAVERYYLDILDVFGELKFLVSTLPPVPLPFDYHNKGHVTKKFVAERLVECQRFFDAAVKNHSVLHHPKMQQLLRLGEHFTCVSFSGGRRERDVSQRSEWREFGISTVSGASLAPRAKKCGELAYDRYIAVPSRKCPSLLLGNSRCLSTFSSVSRRGLKDAISEEDLENVQLGNMLGRGSFSVVYLGLLPGHSSLVAVKVIRLRENADNDFLNSMRKELEILCAARHKNIVSFLGSTYIVKERELRVFTEYIECGNISSMVKKFGALPLVVIQRYMIQILNGLQYLHNMGIVHRDIKGENILVTKKGRCKLVDFGCSDTIFHGIEGANMVDGVQGSVLWMAPEVINGAPTAIAGDIWALGCVGIEMLQRPIWNMPADANPYTLLYNIGRATGPPHGLPTVEEVEKFKGRPEYECFCLYRDFLSCSLRVRAEERASTAELMAHPFLTKTFSKDIRWISTGGSGDYGHSGLI